MNTLEKRLRVFCGRRSLWRPANMTDAEVERMYAIAMGEPNTATAI